MSKLIRSPKFGVVISRNSRTVRIKSNNKNGEIVEVTASEPVIVNTSKRSIASGLFLSQKKTADVFE